MTRVVGRVGAIALNTFREAIRNKVLYLMLLFGLGLIASSWPLSQLSLHEEGRVITDVGLSGMALFSVLIAIFVGVNLVYKELDRKTVFTLIPKPLHRWEFVLGKFAGMLLTLAVQMAIMAALVCLLLVLHDATIEPAIVRAIALLFVEVSVITALAVLFSTFSSPILSGAFTLALFVIGHSTPELKEVIGRVGPTARALASGALHLVPDLHLFWVSGSMVDGRYASLHGDFVTWAYVGSAAAYGLAYTACALGLAALLFSRRDFV